MAIVVDSSVALAWCFADEESPLAGRALRTAVQQGLVVPSIWAYEVSNVLVLALRHQRINANDIPRVLELLQTLAIRVVDFPLPELLARGATLGLDHALTVYDAVYLHLALRENLLLATSDRRLRAAAEAEGCPLLT